MLGLILGRRAGLACDEVMLCLLRFVGVLESDLLGANALGDGVALGCNPGVSEPDGG